MSETKPLPFKPGDWIADDTDRIARIRRVYVEKYTGKEELLFDLHMYDRDGTCLGRVSPAMGGPRTFEPACSSEGWRRIARPVFPLELKWVQGVARFWAGETLPPANWTPPPPEKPKFPCRPALDDRLKEALEKIADGHNDPRTLAKEVLGKS